MKLIGFTGFTIILFWIVCKINADDSEEEADIKRNAWKKKNIRDYT